MSMGANDRLVQMTALSTKFRLMTAGMAMENCARCPSLKVGSGVSINPPRAAGGRARSAESPAATPRTVHADRDIAFERGLARYGTLMSGKFVKDGGGTDETAGSTIVCSLSA